MSAVLERAPAAAQGEHRFLLLADLNASPLNHRKTFAKDKMAELRDSIRAKGVIQPIIARPLKVGYEVVAGERRFRASKDAGLVEIPAIVRTLTDTEVLELQVIENGQREDPHPLEEAEGYEALLKCTHANGERYTADEIAAKVGKSRSYVFGRLKLCALCPEGRKAFYDGELDASRALLIARIGHHDTQRQALKDVTQGPLATARPDVLPRGARAHRQELHAAAEERGVRYQGRRARREGRRLRPVPEAHRQPGGSLRRREECRRLHGPEVLLRQAPGAPRQGGAGARSEGKKGHLRRGWRKAFPEWDSPNDWRAMR
jgi:ParB/RepB/Spo0J family partition protein